MDEMADVLAEWRTWAKDSGFARADARLDPLGIPHNPTPLPAGWQGIYGFRWQNSWLKIGKAGPKSNARWLSQHYGAGRAMSTLAFCLIRYGHLAEQEDPALPGLRAKIQRVSPEEIGNWMKGNTERVNTLIGSEMGSTGLARLESIAHRVLKPVFEGPWKFGGLDG